MEILTLSIFALGFLAFCYAMGEVADLILGIRRERAKERVEHRERMEAGAVALAASEKRLAELKRWRESMRK